VLKTCGRRFKRSMMFLAMLAWRQRHDTHAAIANAAGALR
jgi:hypothetical protein